MATGGLALDDHPLAMGRMKTRPTTGSQKRRSIHELRVLRPWSENAAHQATIDRDGLAGEISGGIRAQESDQIPHVWGFADTPEWDFFGQVDPDEVVDGYADGTGPWCEALTQAVR